VLDLVVEHGNRQLIGCPSLKGRWARLHVLRLVTKGEAVVQLLRSERHVRCRGNKVVALRPVLYLICIKLIVNGVRRRSRHLIEHDILIETLHIWMCSAVSE